MRFIYSKTDLKSKKIGCIEVLDVDEAVEYLYDIFPNLLQSVEEVCVIWKVNEEVAKHLGNDYLESLAKNNLKKATKEYCYIPSVRFI